jgi:hypothetical protein
MIWRPDSAPQTRRAAKRPMTPPMRAPMMWWPGTGAHDPEGQSEPALRVRQVDVTGVGEQEDHEEPYEDEPHRRPRMTAES